MQGKHLIENKSSSLGDGWKPWGGLEVKGSICVFTVSQGNIGWFHKIYGFAAPPWTRYKTEQVNAFQVLIVLRRTKKQCSS
jgi:hypothetical protein